jgi:hypothetical protein
MPILFNCSCSKRLQVRDELASRKVRCPGCGATVPVPAVGKNDVPAAIAPAAPATRASMKPPPFPILGICIGWAAILIGSALIAGGVLITMSTYRSNGDFKPGGLMVIAFPGVLWIAAGGLLLGLRQRFVIPFCVFLGLNWLVGIIFTTQARHLGGPSDTRIFAAIGLGFLLVAILFQLFHGFLMRDVRRQAPVANAPGSPAQSHA